MRDVLPTLLKWQQEGRHFAIAMVVQTWGSSPRPVGSIMAVRDDGAIVGSVSGGCVEAAVVEASLASLASGEPKMHDFGALTDASVWEVGLSCGGHIRVWLDPHASRSDVWARAFERMSGDLPTVVVSRYEPFEQRLWTPDEPDSPFAPSCLRAITSRTSMEVEIEGSTWFAQAMPCRERLIIIGAVHIAIPLVNLARTLGLETIVVDPRAVLANSDRFPVQPDRFCVDWPQKALGSVTLNEETYAVLLTHDPKIDNDALAILLRSPARYIGALGSHTTHAKRVRDLRELGFTEAEVGRIYGPVGLKIGARSPEEIAVSIIAQIVQVRNAQR